MIAKERYATPAAFRRALTDRLKELAKESRWTLQQLQRQVAYDRILERLYLVDDGWIVKGATALLARDLGVRGSLDIDLYREVAWEVAESDLRRAAATDIGDWFRFEIGAASVIGTDAVRLPVDAIIGATTWAAFHVDLVGADLRMTGQPEDVPPLARGVIPNVEQRGYRAYPLTDHIADKVAATYERHGDTQMPSTRFRDLVDLVAIIAGASVNAEALRHTSQLSESDRLLVEALQADGRAPYAALARQVGLNEKAVRRRVADLRSNGVIEITTVSDPAALGYGVNRPGFHDCSGYWATASAAALV
jgi:hypothetical protein